uniref:Uncharacterized protein n=1 Tax=Arundo donax TaxID=35708 RepID=A0A0A8YV34_ARUDO
MKIRYVIERAIYHIIVVWFCINSLLWSGILFISSLSRTLAGTQHLLYNELLSNPTSYIRNICA